MDKRSALLWAILPSESVGVTVAVQLMLVLPYLYLKNKVVRLNDNIANPPGFPYDPRCFSHYPDRDYWRDLFDYFVKISLAILKIRDMVGAQHSETQPTRRQQHE